MVEVNGDFCPNVQHECLQYRGPPGSRKYVCEKYGPSKCLSATRRHMDFCMDQYEYPNVKGELPKTEMTWYQAKDACTSVGKRLCTTQESIFACEGEQMKAYPYGDGMTRDATACNTDRDPIVPFIFGWNKDHTKQIQVGLRPLAEVDQRAVSGAFPNCVSPFGVYDGVGNLDEWTTNPNNKAGPSGEPSTTNVRLYFSVLHSGHYVRGARNECRGITPGHGPTFSMYITGARCCSDPVE